MKPPRAASNTTFFAGFGGNAPVAFHCFQNVIGFPYKKIREKKRLPPK
jgi:hypothetical protein